LVPADAVSDGVPAWRRIRAAVQSIAVRDPREFLSIAAEALWRYKLRTALSILGVVLGVAAVIAMMSVSDGARREALQQVQLLGLNNLVVRSRGGVTSTSASPSPGLTAGDAEKLLTLIPLTQAVSPLIDRFVQLSSAGRSSPARALGVRSTYQTILHLNVSRGRLLSALDEGSAARVCVVGAPLARSLFEYRDPIGETLRMEGKYFSVVGVLTDQASVRGLNALADRRTVQRKDPRRFGRLQVEEFRLFYNPRWSHFGDAVQPAGTYYYDKSNPEVDPLWNIFDQVLLRAGLLDRFRSENLKILTTDGTDSFTKKDGRPNADVFSDHLPIWFQLDLSRRGRHASNRLLA